MNARFTNEEKIRHKLLELEEETQIDLQFIMEQVGDLAMGLDRQELHQRICDSRGKQLYADMLFVLTHQHFPIEVAETCWKRILEHKDGLNQTLGRNAGIVVAALDYLTNSRIDNYIDFILIPEAAIWAVSEIALRDHLTGLYDRGTFQAKLSAEMKRFSRYGNDVSLILMDIDDFKELNDLHGHIAGDQALSRIGRLLQDEIRDIEVIARIGGEEFAILLPQTDLSEAYASAERIRKTIEDEFNIDHQVTVSIGVANCPRNACSMHNLILQADQALYHAKLAGKNQTVKANFKLVENK
jgi:diguanylate cyclase (GGDEF)-like protein